MIKSDCAVLRGRPSPCVTFVVERLDQCCTERRATGFSEALKSPEESPDSNSDARRPSATNFLSLEQTIFDNLIKIQIKTFV